MNAENFSDYLKNPSQLYQISYQELKSLVLQYPYSPNLRYLLMRKAKMENHSEYDRLLNMASTYSIDRSFLFKKMKTDRLIPQFEENYELNEEYLELKDLAALEVEAELLEATGAEKTDELAFALDDLVEQPASSPPVNPPVPEKTDNMSDENTESLLERLLDGDFADIDDVAEHEALNNLSLADISKAENAYENDAVEEQIIENSLEELAEKSDLIQQFEAGSKKGLKEKKTEKDSKEEKNTDAETTASNAAPDLENYVESLADSDIILEKEEAIIAQENNPDIELKSLEDLAKADKQETETEGEKNETSLTAEKVLVDEENNSLDERTKNEVPTTDDSNENTLTLKDLSKKHSEKPQKLKPVAETSFAPKPLPKSSFNSWLQQYKSPLLDSKLDSIKEVPGKKKAKKKKSKKKAKDTLIIAKASVQEDLEIATETLASLLEKQGHYSRAIRMYETLRLRNPEKNAFFAAKIEALQKLRDEE